MALACIACACAVRATEVGRYANGEIAYVNGGFGEEEADALRAEARRYPLQLVFALRSGEFVADVDVRILDHEGRHVMELADQGPILLAQLPPGRYTIEAEFEGVVKRRAVDVGSRPTKVGFAW
jgi:hypothetical protein